MQPRESDMLKMRDKIAAHNKAVIDFASENKRFAPDNFLIDLETAADALTRILAGISSSAAVKKCEWKIADFAETLEWAALMYGDDVEIQSGLKKIEESAK